MKKLNYLLSLGILLSAAVVISSCKKEISQPLGKQSVIPTQTNNTADCKPAFLGVYEEYPGNPASGIWTTLAQKWYADGKVKYLKAKHASSATPVLDPILDYFDLQWGEVSYQGNQVYLTDVLNNRVMLRVTLDDQGRPVATYYSYNSPTSSGFMRDTTYYYYSGDRLDYLISLYTTTTDSYTPYSGYRKYIFSYDSHGDLIKAEFPGSYALHIEYDYSKPVTGIINNFQCSSSLKLLEYLDLIKLPMDYAITKTDFGTLYAFAGANIFSEINHVSYNNYVIDNGLVKSYQLDDPYRRSTTLYNGWDCGSVPALSADGKSIHPISNLKEFQDLYWKP